MGPAVVSLTIACPHDVAGCKGYVRGGVVDKGSGSPVLVTSLKSTHTSGVTVATSSLLPLLDNDLSGRLRSELIRQWVTESVEAADKEGDLAVRSTRPLVHLRSAGEHHCGRRPSSNLAGHTCTGNGQRAT